MIVNTCLLLMIKTNGMDAKNSDLKAIFSLNHGIFYNWHEMCLFYIEKTAYNKGRDNLNPGV